MPNAFQINGAGIYKGLFPLDFGFDLRENGIVDAFLCPQAIDEAAGPLARFAFPWLCVFGCNFSSPDGLSLAEIAASKNLYSRAIGPGIIVLPTAHLERLGRDDSPGDRCRLADLPQSRVYLNSHDDCCRSVEWRDPQTVRAPLGRLLAEYAVALLSDDEESPISVAGPPDEVLQSIVAARPCLTVLDMDTTREDSVLRIGCCHTKQYFPRLIDHDVSSILTYDEGSGAWAWASIQQ